MIQGYSIIGPRSFCPHCTTTIAWYDLIPVISWLSLRARCRTCQAPISALYPFIELLTAVVGTLLISFISPLYWPAYGIFFSALIILIRIDIETMLISRYTTLFLIPFAWLASFTGYLPISFTQSLLGTFVGYFILWSVAKLFYILRNKEGMGEGDFELLATIGAFTGPLGAWLVVVIASMLGTLLGIYTLIKHKSGLETRIPFGPALALATFIYIFAQKYILLIVY